MANLEIWNALYQTDPEHTKSFRKGGGFSGTAIKPFWIIKRLTELLGPCGIKWKVRVISNEFIEGVYIVLVELRYWWNDEEGVIQQFGQTQMVGTNKNGSFVDEEAPKKAFTDALTKCASYLGLGGDVHMGQFDDSKYVDSLTEAPPKPQSAAPEPKEVSEAKQKMIKAAGAGTLDKVSKTIKPEILAELRENKAFCDIIAAIQKGEAK